MALLEPFEDFDDGARAASTTATSACRPASSPATSTTRCARGTRLEVGGVIVGDVPSFRVDNMPYGGVKRSGLGREGVR